MMNKEPIIDALKTIKQCCREHEDCDGCKIHDHCLMYFGFEVNPKDWDLEKLSEEK